MKLQPHTDLGKGPEGEVMLPQAKEHLWPPEAGKDPPWMI